MKITSQTLVLFSVSLALFMDVLDTNIINTSIPAIAHSLSVNAIDLKIALISYLLSLAIFIPISGWAADKYGIKKIFIGAFGLFTLSSFFCGYAHTLRELVIARSIQGIGGAFMISLGRLIIARSFKRHELVEAMNVVIIVVSIAVMLGPFVGGLITHYWSWPWIFWVNIPVGICAILLSSYSLKDFSPRHTHSLDLPGFILFGGSLALICFSLSELSESAVNIHFIYILFSTAMIMLVIYFIHSKNLSHPIVKINLLRKRTFRISVMGNLFARLGFGGTPFILPLLQQMGLGFTPQLSGLLLAPIAFGIIFSKILSIRILRKIGYRRYLMINTLFVAIALWSFQSIQTHTSPYTIACLTFVFGILISAQYTAMNSLAFADLEEHELSASTSITSTVQVLAQSLGVAVAAILLRYFSSFASPTNALTIDVFHQTFFMMGILTLFSTIIFIGLTPEDGKQMLIKPTTEANT